MLAMINPQTSEARIDPYLTSAYLFLPTLDCFRPYPMTNSSLVAAAAHNPGHNPKKPCSMDPYLHVGSLDAQAQEGRPLSFVAAIVVKVVSLRGGIMCGIIAKQQRDYMAQPTHTQQQLLQNAISIISISSSLSERCDSIMCRISAKFKSTMCSNIRQQAG